MSDSQPLRPIVTRRAPDPAVLAELLRRGNRLVLIGEDLGLDPATGERLGPFFDGGQVQALQALALEAFDAVGASGWGRVDILVDEQARPFLIEVNTVPGMTDHSLVPMAAAAAGIDFDELVWRILEASLEQD